MASNDELRQKLVDMLKQAAITAVEAATNPAASDRAEMAGTVALTAAGKDDVMLIAAKGLIRSARLGR